MDGCRPVSLAGGANDSTRSGRRDTVISAATVADLLDLEHVEVDLYRSRVALDGPSACLYGGQVAAQGLYAAGCTVPAGRLPHSLHGYFLRGGSPARPTVFRVQRDRDGGAFSARRVVGIQEGEVIFNMAASFTEPRPDTGQGVHPIRVLSGPGAAIPRVQPYHASIEARRADDHQPPAGRWPNRLWIRCVGDLPDSPLLHHCLLAYVSDISSGLLPLEGNGARTGFSLDHAVWFHRQPRADDWMLLDLSPQVASGGRGWYTGAIYDATGVRAASIAQEALFGATRSR